MLLLLAAASSCGSLLPRAHANATVEFNTSFVRGMVCWGGESRDDRTSLHGKHLIVNDMTWRPFAYRRNDLPGKPWAGLNVDVLSALSRLLNFTVCCAPALNTLVTCSAAAEAAAALWRAPPSRAPTTQ
jgi:hypothetical protein